MTYKQENCAINNNQHHNQTSFDMVLTQAGSYMHPIIINTPPFINIKKIEQNGSQGTLIFSETPHNFTKNSVDVYLQLYIKPKYYQQYNPPLPTIVKIVDVVDEFTIMTTPFSINTEYIGYYCVAFNLEGFRCKGNIRNRINTLPSKYLVKASGFQGGNEILLCGYSDIKVGDVISITDKIDRFTVLAIYTTESPEDSYNGCKVVVVQETINTTFIEESSVVVEGNDLAEIKYNIPNPKHGVLYLLLNGYDTRNLGKHLIPANSDQVCFNKINNLVYKIGYYNVVLIRGYNDRVPDHYCLQQQDGVMYDSDIINFMQGDVYIKLNSVTIN